MNWDTGVQRGKDGRLAMIHLMPTTDVAFLMLVHQSSERSWESGLELRA